MGRRKGAKNSLESHIKLVILYLEFRKVDSWGYLPYSFFKNLIRWCLDFPGKNSVRRIFDILRYRNIFSIASHGRAGHGKTYLFNPNNRPHIKQMNGKPLWLDEDRDK
jgi:hypothetical protein